MYFYFDNEMRGYEDTFQWDQSLLYLERKYSQERKMSILNALVGCSWLYLVEGPIISGEYNDDPNNLPIKYWRKYLDMGLESNPNNSFFYFISGYTLAMDRHYLGKDYEELGTVLMKKCAETCLDPHLQGIARHFLSNQHSSEYIPINNGTEICSHLFAGKSLLEKYFRELYSS